MKVTISKAVGKLGECIPSIPEGAYLVAKGDVEDEYSDEIICNVRDDSVVNYTIKEEQTNA